MSTQVQPHYPKANTASAQGAASMGQLSSSATRGKEIDAVRAQAAKLMDMSRTFVITATFGLAGVSGMMFYLWRDWKLGYQVHPAWFEPFAAAFLGGLIGFGLSIPFARWFQVQAGLVQVQLRMEENTRSASQTAEKTAEHIRDLAEATATGQWSTEELELDFD